ncbi:hypothetical protein JX265_011654 [Neoarthrinium moseri]|uniref:Aminoglycoside phosphotransferase domain-containing protein n=1 Tax=Neoarthrinium moseri TaxID=1658444 RepID=A0A9P9WBN2_9PEZI|nr:hypothetical protein JX265_011654 [Neoarthrinium moseri]
MGDSPVRGFQEGRLEDLEGHEIKKAHELANTLTINRLASKCRGNPAADLAHILKQQAGAYPQLRGSLERVARTKAATRTRDQGSVPTEIQTSRLDADAQPQPEIDDLLIDESIQVAHSLSTSIMELAGLTNVPPAAASQNVAKLALGVNEAIAKGKILWKLHGTVVLGLSASVVVKIGTSLDLDEVTNLSYINTFMPAIPAPLCLGCLTSTAKKRTYFFMSRSDGVTLETIWADLSVENKLSIKKQLNTIFHSLRNPSRPPHLEQDEDGMPKFGSFASAICKDMRRQQRISTTTIRSEAQFNDFLCHQMGRTVTPWVRMIRSAMQDEHQLVMTHADLHPRNILVKLEDTDEGNEGNGAGWEKERERRVRISAILDWELSGWYPEYWEFVKALSTISIRGKTADWLEYLPTEAIGTWPVELSFDSLLDRWLG